MRPLHKIASFSLTTDGFKKNKAEILRLCEDVMLVAREGPSSAKDTAKKLVGSLSFHSILGSRNPFPLLTCIVVKDYYE